MKINFREASTKRAIVMTITGCITLYNITFGSGASDMDVLIHRVEFWIGMGITIAGMFGFLPDQPTRDPQERTRETDLPEISLVGRSESADVPCSPNTISVNGDGPSVESLTRLYRAQLLPKNTTQTPGPTLRQDGGGYNG